MVAAVAEWVPAEEQASVAEQAPVEELAAAPPNTGRREVEFRRAQAAHPAVKGWRKAAQAAGQKAQLLRHRAHSVAKE